MGLSTKEYLDTISDLKSKNKKLLNDHRTVVGQLENVEAELRTSRSNNQRIRGRERSFKKKAYRIITLETIALVVLSTYIILHLF